MSNLLFACVNVWPMSISSCYVDRTVGFVLVQVLLLLHKPIILLLSLFMNLFGGPFQFIVSNCLSI
jgi:hypothetical protein